MKNAGASREFRRHYATATILSRFNKTAGSMEFRRMSI
jgi:hypothetical protein